MGTGSPIHIVRYHGHLDLDEHGDRLPGLPGPAWQSIDKSLYEAGAIDGISSRWQELKYLTLPQMKPQLIFGAITAVTNSFGVFDIAVSVSGLPSPNYAGHTIVAHLYDYAFIRFQMGYASAIATILFLMTFVLGRVIMAALSEKDGKQGDRHA